MWLQYKGEHVLTKTQACFIKVMEKRCKLFNCSNKCISSSGQMFTMALFLILPISTISILSSNMKITTDYTLIRQSTRMYFSFPFVCPLTTAQIWNDRVDQSDEADTLSLARWGVFTWGPVLRGSCQLPFRQPTLPPAGEMHFYPKNLKLNVLLMLF